MIMPIIPILPSINTCMTLSTTTTTTTTSATTALPEVNTTQLQAFADVCTGIEPVPVLNSLVSATKVVSSTLLTSPINHVIQLPEKIPISSLPVPIKIQDLEVAKPIMDVDEEKPTEEETVAVEDEEIVNSDAPKDEDEVVEDEKPLESPQEMESTKGSPKSETEPMELGSILPSPRPSTPLKLSDDVLMCDDLEAAGDFDRELTADDLLLMCDLFYLPFEHGGKALHLLNEFHWLKINASTLVASGYNKNTKRTEANPEVEEWLRRADAFEVLCNAIQTLAKRIALCENREICFDLYTYVWEINGVTSLLSAFVKWLALGHFPDNINNFTQGSYTCKSGFYVCLTKILRFQAIFLEFLTI